jgi:hypothetical protein
MNLFFDLNKKFPLAYQGVFFSEILKNQGFQKEKK